MHDPFFSASSQAFFQPFFDLFSLQSLSFHAHEILFVFAVYHTIFEYIAPPLSSVLLSKRYNNLSYESKLRWNMHCVSMVQSVGISGLALWTIFMDQERKNMNLEERIWGYTGAAGLVQALATGYFLLDLVVMVRYLKVFGLGMLAHASSCLLTYTLGFRPIVNYYGCVFVLYELSTPFLNIHWFFDKLGMTGTKAQLYNGVMLLVVFFSCRLVWGAYSSFNIYRDVWNALQFDPEGTRLSSNEEMMRFGGERLLPTWLVVLYMCGHATLQVLNVFWFGKMLAAVKKRFVGTEKKKQ